VPGQLIENNGAMSSPEPADHYLIPIEGLKVPRSWIVGNVTIHPGSAISQLIAARPPVESTGGWQAEHVIEVLNQAGNSSVAEVGGVSDVDAAIELARLSLGALRLFARARRQYFTGSFGLPGDLYQSHVSYVAVWKQSAAGFTFSGDHRGYEFTEESMNDWESSNGFQYLHAALKDPNASDGAKRAVNGVRAYDRAAREHRPDLKMIGFAMALEAWLLPRRTTGQSLRLARHVSWFGCGQHNNDLCGRARPVCPYLHLSPDSKRDRDRLKVLQSLGDHHVSWRCAEWLRVRDWYEARSDAAHGDPLSVSTAQADEADYWIAHTLSEPILEWLGAHPIDPVTDLDQALNHVKQPSGWPQMLVALDAASPPAVPPPLG